MSDLFKPGYGMDSGCGGGVHTVEARITTTVRFSCEKCGETYSERCRCTNAAPCPRCGMSVFFRDGAPDQHMCLPPVPDPSPTPAIFYGQLLRQAHDAFAARFYRMGREDERNGRQAPDWANNP